MTAPGPAADAQSTVQAVQDNAQRLGLVWVRKRATVTQADPLMIRLDADTEPISATSMIGGLTVDQRVYVDVVPPSGNFVSGIVGGLAVGTVVGWTAATGNSAFVSAETMMLATGSIDFEDDCAYEIDFEVDVEGSADGNFANLQIRRTSGAGTVIRANSGHPMSRLLGFGSTCKGSAIVINTTGVTISDVAVLTLSSPMAGTVRIVGATNRLAFLRARYIGPAGAYTSATAL